MGRDRDPGVKRGGMAGLRRKKAGKRDLRTPIVDPLLSIDNIAKLVNAANHVVSLKVTFLHYKHSYNQPPFSVIIQRQSSLCPVQFMLEITRQFSRPPFHYRWASGS